MYTFNIIVGNIIPKGVKCIHSATKKNSSRRPLLSASVSALLNGALYEPLETLFRAVLGWP